MRKDCKKKTGVQLKPNLGSRLHDDGKRSEKYIERTHADGVQDSANRIRIAVGGQKDG